MVLGTDFILQQSEDYIKDKYGIETNMGSAIESADQPMKFTWTDAVTGSIDEPFVLDRWSKSIESMTDLRFQDEKDTTQNAVQNWSDLAELAMGTSGATWGGAIALMAGELPSEVVDIALLAGTSWWTGCLLYTSPSPRD